MTATVSIEDGRCLVKGVVSYATVVQLRKRLMKELTRNSSLTIDLHYTTEADNSAVALMTALFRASKKQGGQLIFTNLPPRLRALLNLSNLEELLPIE